MTNNTNPQAVDNLSTGVAMKGETMNEYSVHLNLAIFGIKTNSEDEAIEMAYWLAETMKQHLKDGVTFDIDFHGIDQTK
jgi:hypothetical protein